MVSAVAMLLRYRSTDPNPNSIKYVNSTTLKALFKSLKYPSTGFKEAMLKSKFDISQVYLKSTTVKDVKQSKKRIKELELDDNELESFREVKENINTKCTKIAQISPL